MALLKEVVVVLQQIVVGFQTKPTETTFGSADDDTTAA